MYFYLGVALRIYKTANYEHAKIEGWAWIKVDKDWSHPNNFIIYTVEPPTELSYELLAGCWNRTVSGSEL